MYGKQNKQLSCSVVGIPLRKAEEKRDLDNDREWKRHVLEFLSTNPCIVCHDNFLTATFLVI